MLLQRSRSHSDDSYNCSSRWACLLRQIKNPPGTWHAAIVPENAFFFNSSSRAGCLHMAGTTVHFLLSLYFKVESTIVLSVTVWSIGFDYLDILKDITAFHLWHCANWAWWSDRYFRCLSKTHVSQWIGDKLHESLETFHILKFLGTQGSKF